MCLHLLLLQTLLFPVPTCPLQFTRPLQRGLVTEDPSSTGLAPLQGTSVLPSLPPPKCWQEALLVLAAAGSRRKCHSSQGPFSLGHPSSPQAELSPAPSTAQACCALFSTCAGSSSPLLWDLCNQCVKGASSCICLSQCVALMGVLTRPRPGAGQQHPSGCVDSFLGF